MKRTNLTKEEKQSVIKFWGITPASYEEFEIYKTFNGFDVRFMPMSIYLPLISRRLNDYKYTEILEHKGGMILSDTDTFEPIYDVNSVASIG